MSKPIGGSVGGPSSPIPTTPATDAAEPKPATQTTQSAETQTQAKSSYEPKAKTSEFALTGKMQQAFLQSQLNPKTVERGAKGADVAKLQDLLIARGYMTADQKATGPGIFGPKTEAALKKFQQDQGLKQDGIYGPKSFKALQGGAGQPEVKKETSSQEVKKTSAEKPQLDGTKEVPDSQLQTPRSLEEQAKLYDKYSKLIPEGKLKDGKGEMNIVGLRHHDISSSKDLRSYDDRFAVMWKDEAGNKRISVFQGATHTGQKDVKDTKMADGSYRAKFTDVDGDGRSDIAYVKPGTYDFHLGKSDKYGDHLRPDQKIGAYRDTNHDGKITGDEAKQDFNATAILFHKGGETAPRSVGCQTMPAGEFEKFMELMKQDPNKKVTYTLVDASE